MKKQLSPRSIKRLLTLILAAATLAGCSGGGNPAGTGEASQSGSAEPEVSGSTGAVQYEKTVLSHTDFDNVAIRGRSLHTEKGYRLEWPYSGFTLRGYFDGSIRIQVDDADGYAQNASLTVTVDGNAEQKTLLKGAKSLEIADVEKGYHEITVRKGAEITAFRFTLTGLSFTGCLLEPEEPKLRIEFIGDSITNGVGATTEDGTLRYPHGVNCLSAYSGMTAGRLGAEANIIALSGWGISKGSSSPTEIIPPIYGKYSPFDESGAEWDFSSFRPDVIVLALGTNDGGADPEKFRTESVAFLKQLREKNPGVPIIWIYGMMGSTLSGEVKQAIADSGLDGIKYVKMPANCAGGDRHPTEKAQEEYADKLIKEINRIIK